MSTKPHRNPHPRHSGEGRNPVSDMDAEQWEQREFTRALSSEKPPQRGKLKARDYKPSGKFPVVDQSQSEIAGWTDDETLVIRDGLPYVVFGDHSRTFKYVDQPFALGADGTQLLKPSSKYCARFFFYACLHVDLPSRGYNRHFKFLKEKTLPLPPKPEQQKIAAVLWKLQHAIATQDRLIAAIADLKQSAMQRLFTHGLNSEPLKDTEIGPMPESWTPRPLPELCDIQSGGTPRKSITEYWQGDTPWVSGKDLKAVALDDAKDHVSDVGIAAGSRLAPADSVLLLVRGMGLAKDLPVSVITRPMAFNQDIKALISRGEYSGSFIRSAIYAGKERLRSRIVPSAHGTLTLNLDDLHSFRLACPPSDTDEAKDIASALATIDRKLAHHRAKRAALDDAFQSALHRLMTGAVRVANLDIDTSEVTDHFAGAGKMVGHTPEGATH